MPALALALLAAAELTVQALTGLPEAAARERLGPPDVARHEAKGAMWTYRKEGCVLMVFLADKGDGLKVTGLTAGARRAGEQPPDVATCLAAKKG